MAWTRPSIKITEEGASRNFHLQNDAMHWGEVVEIVAVALDKVTYFEDFLILKSGSSFVSFGELDINFRDFEALLFEKFPDLPRDWQRTLLDAGVDVYRVLWTKRCPSA